MSILQIAGPVWAVGAVATKKNAAPQGWGLLTRVPRCLFHICAPASAFLVCIPGNGVELPDRYTKVDETEPAASWRHFPPPNLNCTASACQRPPGCIRRLQITIWDCMVLVWFGVGTGKVMIGRLCAVALPIAPIADFSFSTLSPQAVCLRLCATARAPCAHSRTLCSLSWCHSRTACACPPAASPQRPKAAVQGRCPPSTVQHKACHAVCALSR